MILSKNNETGKQTSHEVVTFPLQGKQNAPILCGPGSACAKETKTSKWKIVIMLIVLAAVGIAIIFRKILFPA